MKPRTSLHPCPRPNLARDDCCQAAPRPALLRVELVARCSYRIWTESCRIPSGERRIVQRNRGRAWSGVTLRVEGAHPFSPVFDGASEGTNLDRPALAKADVTRAPGRTVLTSRMRVKCRGRLQRCFLSDDRGACRPHEITATVHKTRSVQSCERVFDADGVSDLQAQLPNRPRPRAIRESEQQKDRRVGAQDIWRVQRRVVLHRKVPPFGATAPGS
jgi:hypothetical protein